MGKRVLALVAAAACVVAIGACGSSDSSSSSSSGGDVTAFCDKVKELKSLSDPFASVQPGDVQGAKDAVNKIRSEVSSIDEVAPEEVKADVDQVKSTLDSFASKIADANTPAQLVAAAQSFQADASKISAASARLKTYTKQNCNT